MTITLYGSLFSQPTRAVYWFMQLNNIPFKFQSVDITKGEHFKPEFVALNPQHTVPVLKDSDGTVVYESTAIVYYLRERYGDKANLHPGITTADLKTRTRIAQFLGWYPSGLRTPLVSFIFPTLLAPVIFKAPPPDAAAQAAAWDKVHAAVRNVNDNWVQNGYIAGDKPTFADLQCYSELQQLAAGHFDFAPYPNVTKFFSLISQLPHHDAVFGTLLGAAKNFPTYSPPPRTTVLITGANGHTGSAIARVAVKLAQELKIRVIVGARRLDTLAEFTAKGAEPRVVDFNDFNGSVAAMKGVDAVWITAPNPSKDSKAFDRTNIAKKGIDAAKAAGVKFVLLGSVAGAEYEAIIFAKEFRDAEKHLEASGLPHCHLRMGAFSENVLMSQQAIASGAYYQPLTNGAYCPVSLADIGEVSTRILANYSAHVGKAYTLTGPDALNGEAQAAALTQVLGKPIKHVNPGPDNFRQALAPFMAPYQVEGMLEMYNVFESGMAGQPSPAFEEITGHKGTSFVQALHNLKAFGLLKA